MVLKTLASRIIALSSTWIIMALVTTSVLLVYFYRDHSAQYYDAHVSMHLEELIEASSILPDGSFELAAKPSDPRYHDLQSGWYWQVNQSGTTLKRSASLGGDYLDPGTLQAGTTAVIQEIAGPLQENLRLHVISVRPDPRQEPLLLMATAPMSGITDGVLTYSKHVTGSFMVLGFVLILTVVMQVRVTLKPLQVISAGISEIRAGKASKLPPCDLEDLQPLVSELNNLLEHNTVLLKRARNRLGNLAHSVKNPLTVIKTEAENMDTGQRELILRQTGEIIKHVNHYLSRARAFGTGKVLGSRSEVKPLIDDLVYAMQRIYQDRDLHYDLNDVQSCFFRGEGQDLQEMMGNLLDNASKWAQSRVLVHCTSAHERLLLVVEDDGPGISEDKFESVLLRGFKLDESKPGHGQGLDIVKEIVDLYGGVLKLSRSPLGGLKVELDLPAA